MYSPVHATTGLLLAQFAPNPYLAFSVGVISHYFLDAIPHGDLNPLPMLDRMPRAKMLAVIESIDLPVTALLLFWLIPHVHHPAGTLLAGAIGGIFPDILWGSLFILERLRPHWTWLLRPLRWHHYWHERFHAKKSYDLPHAVGIAYQVLLIASVVLLYAGR